MKNQDSKPYNLDKRTVNIDAAKIVKSTIELAKSADGIRSVAIYAREIAKINKEFASNFVFMHERLAEEAIPLYERTKHDYRRCVGRSLFAKDAGLKREIKASELATEETRRVTAMVGGIIKESTRQLMEVKKELDAGFNQVIARLIETGCSAPALGEGNGLPRHVAVEESVGLEDFIIDKFVE